MAKPIHEMSEDEYREFRRSSTPDEFHAAHEADNKRRKTEAKRAEAARLRNAPKLHEMTDAEKDHFYRTASHQERFDAADAETRRMNAQRKKAAPARKTAPRRVVINKAVSGQSVPIQAGRTENSTVVTGGTARASGSSSSSQGAKKAAAKKTAAPRGGGRPVFNNAPGAVVGMQAGDINGGTVVVNSNLSAPPATGQTPAPAAPAAKKTAAAKKTVKKAPAKKAAAEVPPGPPRPDVAAAVAQVQADQAKRLAAEEKARKAAARAATRPGLPPEQEPEVTGLPLPTQLPKTQAAKKAVKKAPARPPMTFAARHRKVRRALRLVRRKPHVALGLVLVFAGTGLFHVAVRSARFGGRKSWAGLKAMGRGYDQYRRMARAAKLQHKHAGCEKCKGTGVITLRASDGSYAGSRSCRG